MTVVDTNGNESASSGEVSASWPIDSDGNGVLDFLEYLYSSDPTLSGSSGFS